METWKFLAWSSGLLVVWAVLSTLLGEQPGPAGLVVGAAFAVGGFYASMRVVEWLTDGGDDEPGE